MTNAILMASGLGTRMRPLTYTTPKPLIRVGDKPMIETIIDALENAKIENIYVVVGYLGEQFIYLKQKYHNLHLIKNPDFDKVNNIASIYYAKDKLIESDCFICEADLYISNLNIFNTKLHESCYFGKMVAGYSDDWVFDVNNEGYITRIGKNGLNQYNMVGLSYFTKNDSVFLAKAIERTYNSQGYENMFWDEVVNRNLDILKLKIYPITDSQIIEIDTVEELKNVNKEVINGSRKITQYNKC